MSRQHNPGSQARSPAFYSSEKLFVKEFPFRQRWLSSCQLFGRLLSVERRSCELITLMVTNQNPGCGGRWPMRGLILLIMRWWYLDPDDLCWSLIAECWDKLKLITASHSSFLWLRLRDFERRLAETGTWWMRAGTELRINKLLTPRWG